MQGSPDFNGVKTAALTLPAGWVAGDDTSAMSQIDSSLTPVKIGTERRRLGIGATLTPRTPWSFGIDYRVDTRDGLLSMAAPIGHSPGNTRIAILPQPIDYTDHRMDFSLGYNLGKWRYEINYHLSLFANNFDTLAWESPFTTTGSRYSDGSLALPPDNQFHQLSFSGVYQWSQATRISGLYALGLQLQDESFAPFTINSALARDLPRASLDGKVYVTTGRLSIDSQVSRELRLNASLRLDERDNHTPLDTYSYVWGDSQDTDPPRAAVASNQPYSYRKQLLQLGASYRLPHKARLNGGYEREEVNRTYSEVERTTEDRLEAGLRLYPGSTVQLALKLGRAQRDGSGYVSNSGDNPLLRKYSIADRDQDSLGLELSWQPHEQVSISATARHLEEEFGGTIIGLTQARHSSLGLDASVMFHKDLYAYLFYNHERIISDQAGSIDSVADVPAADWPPNWYADYDDTIDSLGVGLKRNKVRNKLDVGADYVYSRSCGQIDFSDRNTVLTVGLPFPESSADVHTLKLYADYRMKKNLKLRANYVYEDFASRDWALDGVTYDSIGRVLPLGEVSPDYQEHMVGVSVVYIF